MSTDEMPTFAALLGRFRTAVGLTQEEVAERAGLSVQAVGALERGNRTRPRSYTVRRLADALDLAPDDRAAFEAAARGPDRPLSRVTPPTGEYLGALPATLLIDRIEERQTLLSVLDACTAGSGRLVVLVGELGAGKTRLLQEIMVEALSRGAVTGAGSPSAGGETAPYAPFLHALAEVVEGMPTGVQTEAQRLWRRLTGQMSAADTSGGATSELQRVAIEDGVVALLSTAGRAAPVVLLLDDMDEADEASLGLLERLARRIGALPVAVVSALGDPETAGELGPAGLTLQSLARERLADRILVRRFTPDETAQLVSVLMGEHEVSSEFSHFVFRRTKGLPRLVHDLIRSLGGRLELQGEIGAGSMGRVFRALDRETGGTVAAKLILARDEIDLDALLRFQQEGALLARLDHPHIVRVHDTFVEEHATCIVMELLEGEPLSAVLKEEGPLPLSRAKTIGSQVADALDYAHQHRIVHRDIKPDNVMLLPGDHAKVTDFGIARLLRQDAAPGTIATTGMRMGTPLYMAPEQIQGKKLDGRTDVYALGAMLYHMVAGHPPFEGNDSLAVAVTHLQEEPVPPSQVNAAVPAAWDAFVLKAMAKDPSKRFQSAGEMERALASLTDAAPTHTRSPARSWRRAGVAAGIVLTAALAGGVWRHAMTNGQSPGPVATVDSYLAQHHFSGYVYLARQGQVLLDKGYGLADSTAGVPNTKRSKWIVPGANRFITAIAILRLQDQHRLSVQDRICRYLTPCPRKWKPITIHQLLLDTSGLGTYDMSAYPGGVSGALARCKALPLAGAPGTFGVEGRCNLLLLNRIVVKVSGRPWADAMKKLLFDPAHMTDSGQVTNAVKSPQRVQGYRRGVPISLGNLNNYYSLYSSIRDLVRLDQALLAGRLLSKGALRVLFAPRLQGGAVVSRYIGSHATELAACYECYVRLGTGSTLTVVDHPGFTNGFGFDNALSPEDGTIGIVAKNDESGPDPTVVLFGSASHLLWDRPGSRSSLASPAGKRIAAYLTRNRFHGYVYLERHSRMILSTGLGMADAGHRVPNTLNVIWPAFAESRFLVAVAIMKLQEEGRLTLRDRICQYVRGCPTAWKAITIWHLLTYTGGMGSYDAFVSGTTVAQNLAGCEASPLVSTPGSIANAWSDCDTLALSVILQRVTGESWETAMRELVFAPAGMTHSGRMTNAVKPPRRGRLYRAGVPTEDLNYDGFYLASTTGQDTIRLAHALIAGTLLSPRSLETMFTPRFHDDAFDSRSPWRGFAVVMSRSTATMHRAIGISNRNGGGEDDEGHNAGFFLEVLLSPEAGSIQIVIDNDTGYLNGGEDANAFDRLVRKPLFGT